MYQRNGVYWLRVWTPLGAAKRVSTETKDAKTATRVAAWVQDVKDRLDRHGVLAAVVSGQLTLAQAYVLGEQDAMTYLAQQQAVASDVVVDDALLGKWLLWARGRTVSARTIADYERQVTTVWPSPRTLSWLQPRTIMHALDALPCAETTKGRYRAALASLCAYLVRQGTLEVNPMASVPGYAQSAVRELYYSDADALRLLRALPVAQRGLEAVMWACAWEWSACAHATVADFDLDKGMAFARGTKNASRQRMTVITMPEAVPMIEQALALKLPAARVWAALENTRTLKVHQGVCRELGLPVTTLHDWRHSFAVRELRKGRSLQFVSQMLGHKNTSLVQTRYGRYVLSDSELNQYAAPLAQREA